jgi:Spy/CpxP family protein refolding chaperone
MSKKLLLILLIISLAINVMAGVMFGHFWLRIHRFREHGRPPVAGLFGDWGRGFMREQLDLTDAQIEELNVLQQRLETEVQPLREELHRVGKEMLLTWKEPDPDTVKAESLHQQLIAIQRDMEAHIFKHLKGVHSILTQEQRDELFDMLEKHPMPPKGRPGP